MELEQHVMKYLENIILNFGKFLFAMILFVAIILSSVISLPFIIGGKLADFFNEHSMHAGKSQITDYSS